MARYEVDCQGCGEELGSTDDPREAHDIASNDSDHEPRVTARGLINKVRYDRANKGR